MENPDEYVKTALRLPKALRDEMKAAGEQAGTSMNAEILARLHASKEAVAASQIVAWLKDFQVTQTDVQRRRDEALWRIIDRADALLANIGVSLEGAMTPESATDALRELNFVRELIDFARVNR